MSKSKSANFVFIALLVFYVQIVSVSLLDCCPKMYGDMTMRGDMPSHMHSADMAVDHMDMSSKIQMHSDDCLWACDYCATTAVVLPMPDIETMVLQFGQATFSDLGNKPSLAPAAHFRPPRIA